MNVRERMEQEEYEFLSPQAQKAAETKGPAGAGGRQRRAHLLPARRRPHSPQQILPPSDAQDAGVFIAGGRPLPHPHDPHAGGRAHRADNLPRTAAQSGSGGGRGLRPRSGPHAVRPRGRKGAVQYAGPSPSATTSSRCAWWTSSNATARD